MQSLFSLTMLLLLTLQPLFAQWTSDSTLNTPVSVGSQDRTTISSITAADGGFIMAWQDGRNGGSANFDIYTQKLDRQGNTLWTVEGSPICTVVGSQQVPVIADDGLGGAIIAWEDGRAVNNLDIYAQRIDAVGNVRWTADGVAVSAASGVQRDVAIISDGNGGAIIAWRDHRAGGSETDIYAQAIDSLGVARWATDGVPVCTAAGRQVSPRMVSDGAGGAIIVWQDSRSGIDDIYAQRIDDAGAPLWANDGISVCSAANFQESQRIITSGTDGVIITWVDFRDDVNNASDIYAQKISLTGTSLWQNDGIAVCTALESQNSPALASDGLGGAIISWDDFRGASIDLYAQRVNAQGQPQWTGDGLQITNLSASEDESVIMPDGQGGVFLAWEDRRNSNFDIYAQRLDAAGNNLWRANGVAISTAAASQRFISMAADNNGGAYLAWEDRRAGSNGDDVYAQQVNGNGELGVITAIDNRPGLPGSFYLDQNFPNPFNPETEIRYQITDIRYQNSRYVQLAIYDVVGRKVRTLVKESKPPGIYSVTWDGRDDSGRELGSGIYFYRLSTAEFSQTRKMLLVR